VNFARINFQAEPFENSLAVDFGVQVFDAEHVVSLLIELISKILVVGVTLEHPSVWPI
jgi:hypothetical protein